CLIGLIVVPLLNANTFHIIERLNKDAALRSSINQVVTNVISDEKNKPITDCLINAKDEKNPSKRLTKQNQCFEDININAILDNINMPIGWYSYNLPTFIEDIKKELTTLKLLTSNEKWDWGGIINVFIGWLLEFLKVIFGWLLSAGAIAMGAPFWFELLGKFINVRNAGQVPESTSKDKPN
ncbi:MAG TPA: hypothetical protein VK211_20530, partial [Kamptonema sp.]|nr:hypothetical protein [Kamptonema sp.]